MWLPLRQCILHGNILLSSRGTTSALSKRQCTNVVRGVSGKARALEPAAGEYHESTTTTAAAAAAAAVPVCKPSICREGADTTGTPIDINRFRSILVDMKILKHNDYGLIKHTRVAVALSGGGDSQCLWELCKQVFHPSCLIAITVDHALRPESAEEAALVHQWVRSRSDHRHIIHRIKWPQNVLSGNSNDTDDDGLAEVNDKATTKIHGNVMNLARDMRYGVLGTICREENVNLILTGHQADDALEGFFWRLSAGPPNLRSLGLGIMSLRPLLDFGFDDIVVARPLLEFPHSATTATLRSLLVPWIEDPTNADTLYQRTRLRNSLLKVSQLKNDEGDFMKRLRLLVNGFTEVHDLFMYESYKFLRQSSLCHPFFGYTLIDAPALASIPVNLATRVLIDVHRASSNCIRQSHQRFLNNFVRTVVPKVSKENFLNSKLLASFGIVRMYAMGHPSDRKRKRRIGVLHWQNKIHDHMPFAVSKFSKRMNDNVWERKMQNTILVSGNESTNPEVLTLGPNVSEQRFGRFFVQLCCAGKSKGFGTRNGLPYSPWHLPSSFDSGPGLQEVPLSSVVADELSLGDGDTISLVACMLSKNGLSSLRRRTTRPRAGWHGEVGYLADGCLEPLSAWDHFQHIFSLPSSVIDRLPVFYILRDGETAKSISRIPRIPDFIPHINYSVFSDAVITVRFVPLLSPVWSYGDHLVRNPDEKVIQTQHNMDGRSYHSFHEKRYFHRRNRHGSTHGNDQKYV